MNIKSYINLMCGIFFFLGKNGINIQKCIECLNIVEKRGPDFSHYTTHGNIFMGQTVLSIVGNYKKENFRSGKKEIIFNGEIYNYRDLGNYDSDTKCLLEMFNKVGFREIIDKLDGMYCFIMLDKEKDLLYVSRDIQGEKGIYYYNDGENIIFSSEIYPIIHYIGKYDLDENILQGYFSTRHFVSTKKTCYKNINILEPGESLVYDVKSLNIINELSFKANLHDLVDKEVYDNLGKKTNNELKEMLKNLIKTNMREMIPNVKFASIVSGGIDSSMLSGIMRKMTDNALYIGGNCIGKDVIADKLHLFEEKIDTKINVVNIDERMYRENLVECQEAFSSPIVTHSAVTYSILCKYLKERKIKVLFTGEGADELFGGYSCYLEDYKDEEYPQSNYSRISDIDCKGSEKKNIDYLKQYIQNIYKKNIDIYKKIDKKNYVHQAQLLTDCEIMMTGVGCRNTDIVGGLNGIEIRSVLYRKDIMKFILNCPLRSKIDFDKKITKILLKDIFEEIFTDKLIFPKQGFCGFPNNCKTLIDNYNLCKKYLGFEFEKGNNVHLEWKFINTEVYLRFVLEKYMK